VTDRCTKAHEYLFLLSKNQRYYFNNEAIKEPAVSVEEHLKRKRIVQSHGNSEESTRNMRGGHNALSIKKTRNRRDVWTIATKPFKGAHFAVFPTALVEPCVLAGSRTGGIVLDPFAGSGTTGVVSLKHGRSFIGIELNPEYVTLAKDRIQTSLKET